MMLSPHRLRRFLPLFLVVALLAPWTPLDAFSAHRILDDEDITFQDQMTAAQIQTFFKVNKSGLARYRGAASIIYNAARDAGINPQILLVLLQKEQGLILGSNLSQLQLDWATGYGVCDQCRLTDRLIQRYRGFDRQVRGAAEQLRAYLDEPSRFAVRAHQMTRIDRTLVIPATAATASLYNYTPHINGNRIFWALWNRWFGRVIPEESLVRTAGETTVWYVRAGVRSQVAPAVLVSRFRSLPILTVSSAELEKYALAPALRRPNFALVRSPKGNTYLLIDDQRRRIATNEILRQLGYVPEEIEAVDDQELALYREGTIITSGDAYPAGALLRHPDGTIAYVFTTIRHRLAPELLPLLFPTMPVRDVSREEWNRLSEGPYQTLANGTLVKTIYDPRVWRIEAGQRRWIPNELVFLALGFGWQDILIVSPNVLTLHPEGPPMDAPTPDIPLQDDRLQRILERSL